MFNFNPVQPGAAFLYLIENIRKPRFSNVFKGITVTNIFRGVRKEHDVVMG